MPDNTSENKAKILIVDDEVIIATDLESRLKALGYVVCGKAANGLEALELVEQQQPDLVMMDIVIQGEMDGIDTAEVIRNKWGVPVIFLTAYSDTGKLEQVQLTYPFGYILKPVQDKEIKVTVEMALYLAKVDADRRMAEVALNERVKELTCLYSIAKLVETPGISLESILQGAVDLVPPAWQHPQLTCARIILSGREYQTVNFKETDWSQHADIVVHGSQAGFIQVFYLKKKTHEGNPFLAQEQDLIEAIAERLGRVVERIWTREALEKVEKRWQNILMEAPQIGVSLDPNAKIIFANKYFLELTGWEAEEVTGQDWFDLFIPEDIRELVRNIFQTVMNSRETHGFSSYENEIISRTGERLNVAWSNVLTKNVNGDVIDVTCLGIDLTERKKTEEVLKSQKDRLKFILEGTNVGTWEWNVQTGETIFNERWAEIIGYTLKEISPTSIETWMNFAHPEDLQASNEALERHFRGEADYYDTECRVKHKAGHWVWVWDRGKVISWTPEGEPLWMYGTHQDITARKLAEETLLVSEKDLKESQRIAHIGSWRLDLATNEVVWSEELYRMYGFDPNQPPPPYTEHMKLFTPGSWEKLSDALAHTADTGIPYELELETVREDGDNGWMWVRGEAVKDELGKIIGLWGAAQDITDRKRVEASLKKSEHRNRTILRTAIDGFWLIEVQGRILEVNDSYCRMSGYSEQELLSMRISDLEAGEDPDEVATHMQQLVKNGQDRFETKHRRKDGSLFEVEVSVQYLPGEEGRSVAFLRDITDRKQYEKKLVGSEERFRTLSEESPLGISLIDDSGRYKYINPAFANIFGYSLSDFKTGADWFRLAFPEKDYRSEVIRSWKKDLADNPTGKSRPRIYEVTCKDGSVKTILFRPVTTTSFGQFVLYEDITERNRAEEERRRLKQDYETLFRKMLDGFALHEIICDVNGNPIDYRFLAVNPAFEKMTGLTSVDVVNRTVLEILPATEPYWIETYGKVALTGTPVFFENFSAEINKYFEVTAFSPSQGQFACIFQDVTDRKAAEYEKEKLQAQLQQAQKMEAVGTLAGGVAHDFNNLLQAINGYTQLLLMEKSEDDPEYGSLTAIQKSGNRASDLVRSLLLFSRKADSERKPMELNLEVEHARKILERTIPKMVEIELRSGDRLWSVIADPVQVEQILLNLGTNAADAMPDGGKLIIETINTTFDEDYVKHHAGVQPGRYVLLTVSDTGQGMDKETQEKIFEPFFTTKEFGKGTGLGLASVYGIVKSHGGYISCYSEVGQGTTFKIYLPAIVQPEIEETKEVEPQPISRGTETILLVDDEEAIRGFAQQALMKFGYKVFTASTGEEALELYSVQPNQIDLIVMDLGMPGMGGHKCLQELLKINPEVRVVIASGYSINGQVKQSMEAGAKGYVGKPYQLADLLNTVRAVLDEKE